MVGLRAEVGAGARVVGCSVVGDCETVAPGVALDGVRQPADCP